MKSYIFPHIDTGHTIMSQYRHGHLNTDNFSRYAAIRFDFLRFSPSTLSTLFDEIKKDHKRKNNPKTTFCAFEAVFVFVSIFPICQKAKDLFDHESAMCCTPLVYKSMCCAK